MGRVIINITLRKVINKNDIASFVKYRISLIKLYQVYAHKLEIVDKIYLGTEEEFFDSLFTIFHELGHLRQEIYEEEYPNEIKEVLKREKYINIL